MLVMCSQVFGSLQPNTVRQSIVEGSGGQQQAPSASSGGGGGEVFVWQHSNSRVFEPALPYSHHGDFLNFQLYNVESRDRVKCVSAKDGQLLPVPSVV